MLLIASQLMRSPIPAMVLHSSCTDEISKRAASERAIWEQRPRYLIHSYHMGEKAGQVDMRAEPSARADVRQR
jgi:hypothetical protein